MRLLFCTEVQPHAQFETGVVMQGLLSEKTQKHTYMYTVLHKFCTT